MNTSKKLCLGSFIILTTLSSAIFAYEQKIYLNRIINDKNILIEVNRNVYKLEVGIGCRSFKNYVGKQISISSTSKPAFGITDASSRIKLPGEDCIIWRATKLN